MLEIAVERRRDKLLDYVIEKDPTGLQEMETFYDFVFICSYFFLYLFYCSSSETG